METKVKDVYKIFIFPDDGLMQLTPKKDFEEALGKNTPRKPKILSGEVLLDSTEENGTQYILIQLGDSGFSFPKRIFLIFSFKFAAANLFRIVPCQLLVFGRGQACTLIQYNSAIAYCGACGVF